MSTPETGIEKVVAGAVEETKALLTEDRAAEVRQLDLIEPTPEDMLLSRADLGARASNVEVLSHARERRRGRPKNSRNRRTDDFERYILSFGQDPAITLMQIQSTPPEVLMEQSRKVKESRRTRDGRTITVTTTMSYEAAMALKKQCAAELMPYVHGKKPISVDMSFNGIGDLVIEGVTHSREEVADIVDADFLEVEGGRGDEERAA